VQGPLRVQQRLFCKGGMRWDQRKGHGSFRIPRLLRSGYAREPQYCAEGLLSIRRMASTLTGIMGCPKESGDFSAVIASETPRTLSFPRSAWERMARRSASRGPTQSVRKTGFPRRAWEPESENDAKVSESATQRNANVILSAAKDLADEGDSSLLRKTASFPRSAWERFGGTACVTEAEAEFPRGPRGSEAAERPGSALRRGAS